MQLLPNRAVARIWISWIELGYFGASIAPASPTATTPWMNLTVSRVASELSITPEKTHLQVGVITKPHGVRGEMKVRLYNEQSESLVGANHVVVQALNGQARLMEIESVRGNAKALILALAGVDTCDQAEAMRGSKLWVDRNTLDPLSPGEYYLVDLVGCSLLLDGQSIATVCDVRPDPSVDTMILTMADGSTAEVPIVDAWVGKVDMEGRTVQLLSEDGIIT